MSGQRGGSRPRPGVIAVSVVVDMEMLLTACSAVAPWAGREKEGRGRERVRVVVDPAGMRLTMAACSVTRAAVVTMPLEEADDVAGAASGPVDLDLLPSALRVLEAVFRRVGADRGRLTLRLRGRVADLADAEVSMVELTNVSGLVDGRTVRVHAQPPWGNGEEERDDAVRTVLGACGGSLAGSASLFLGEADIRPVLASARAFGAVQVRASTMGDVLVVAGAGAHPVGLVLLAVARRGWGEDGYVPSAGVAVIDAAVVTDLMPAIIEGAPAGG